MLEKSRLKYGMGFMIHLPAILCVVGAVAVLVVLSVIDLRHFLLPDKLVAAFAGLGVLFHVCTHFIYVSPSSMAIGAIAGGGLLFIVRTVSNHVAKDDTLGLGDVKLLAAAGLWLGYEYIFIAMTLGALAGVFHGLGVMTYRMVKTKAPIRLSMLSVPAGPGFAIGIVIAGIYAFTEFHL